MIKSTFILALICVVTADIHTISDLKEMIPFVDDKTLIFMDIDDTLLVPLQYIGYDHWAQKLIIELKKQGLTETDAYRIQHAIRLLSNVKFVQDDTDSIVETLQNKSLYTMGLTAQSSTLIEHTSRQLRSLNIDFKKKLPESLVLNYAHALKHGNLGGIINGLIFAAGGSSKGEIASEIISRYITNGKNLNTDPDAQFPFNKIIMVDDSMKNVLSVQTLLKEAGFISNEGSYVGFHYNRADILDRLDHLPPNFGDVQLELSNFKNGLATDEIVQKYLDEHFVYEANAEADFPIRI